MIWNAMKSFEKIEQMVDQRRSGIILWMLLLALLVHVCACARIPDEVPATEVYSDAAEARSIPDWVPAETNPQVRYYFIPEIDVYYDAYVGEYVYWNGSIWVYSATLPYAYADFDLYNAHIVFLSVGVTRPWVRNAFYVHYYPVHYFHGRHGHRWRCYDENRKEFFVSHPVQVRHRDAPSRAPGWGRNEVPAKRDAHPRPTHRPEATFPPKPSKYDPKSGVKTRSEPPSRMQPDHRSKEPYGPKGGGKTGPATPGKLNTPPAPPRPSGNPDLKRSPSPKMQGPSPKLNRTPSPGNPASKSDHSRGKQHRP